MRKNHYVTLEIPSHGLGAPQDVSMLMSLKTLTFEKIGAEGLVVIEGSHDGEHFAEAASIDLSTHLGPYILEGVFSHLRARGLRNTFGLLHVGAEITYQNRFFRLDEPRATHSTCAYKTFCVCNAYQRGAIVAINGGADLAFNEGTPKTKSIMLDSNEIRVDVRHMLATETPVVTMGSGPAPSGEGRSYGATLPFGVAVRLLPTEDPFTTSFLVNFDRFDGEISSFRYEIVVPKDRPSSSARIEACILDDEVTLMQGWKGDLAPGAVLLPRASFCTPKGWRTVQIQMWGIDFPIIVRVAAERYAPKPVIAEVSIRDDQVQGDAVPTGHMRWDMESVIQRLPLLEGDFILEGSHDGASYAPIQSFARMSASDAELRGTFAWMRLRRMSGGGVMLARLNGKWSQNDFEEIPIPTANDTGAPVFVGDHGPKRTYIVAGQYDVGGVTLLGSNAPDPLSDSYVVLANFNGGASEQKPVEGVYRHVRFHRYKTPPHRALKGSVGSGHSIETTAPVDIAKSEFLWWSGPRVVGRDEVVLLEGGVDLSRLGDGQLFNFELAAEAKVGGKSCFCEVKVEIDEVHIFSIYFDSKSPPLDYSNDYIANDKPWKTRTYRISALITEGAHGDEDPSFVVTRLAAHLIPLDPVEKHR